MTPSRGEVLATVILQASPYYNEYTVMILMAVFFLVGLGMLGKVLMSVIENQSRLVAATADYVEVIMGEREADKMTIKTQAAEINRLYRENIALYAQAEAWKTVKAHEKDSRIHQE